MNGKWINFPEWPRVGSIHQSSSAVTTHPKQVRIHLQWFSPSLLYGPLVPLCGWWPDPTGALMVSAGLATREQGVFCQQEMMRVYRPSRQCELLSTRWRKEQETASPDHKEGKKKSSFSVFRFVPFALMTAPGLHWKEGLGSWLLDVKYSYRAPSITCAA